MVLLPGADGPQECPCGSGGQFHDCCGPLLRNERAADGAEQLMRSRYTAYVLGDVDHLFRTWHPRTRPVDLTPDEHLRWTGLEVLEIAENDADQGTVTFRAHWTRSGQSGAMHERSTFVRRAGRWVYLEGTAI